MEEFSWQNNSQHLQTEMDYKNEFFHNYDLVNDDCDDFFTDIILHHAPPTPFSSESQSDHSIHASNTFHNTSFLPSAAVNAVASKRSSPRTYILSFDSSTVVPATPEPSAASSPLPAKRALHTQNPNQGSKRTRTSSQTIDHIMAERKRRQELTERFIALSATIPGLNKTDKASVLRAAIDYVKQLKEKVEELEIQNRKSAAETVIMVNKTDSNENEDTTNSIDTNCSILPDMEARVLGKEVLIEIHCEKEYGVELKILDHLEHLHLCVTGSSVLPFGNSALCITITAQMGEEYQMTENDLVKNLRQVLSKSHLVSDSDPY